MLVALALGSFSVHLVAKGQVEAAMGGMGAAIAASTMKRNEDSGGVYNVAEAQNREYLEKLEE